MKSRLDLWIPCKTNSGWGEPVNLGSTVNSVNDENHPFVFVDEQELWFDGPSTSGHIGPAVFCSVLQPDGSWAHPKKSVPLCQRTNN